MNQLKIQDLRQTALTNTDVDRQYMAARDMCDEVCEYYKNQKFDEISEKLLEQIFNVYIQQLQSPYKDIQGNAIRCIIQINLVIQGQQISNLAPILLQKLIKDEPNRDNYLICLQDMVEKLSSNNWEITIITKPVIDEIKIQKQQLQQLRNSNQLNLHQETQQRASLLSDLLRILSSILSKWSDYYANKIVFDPIELIKFLFDNILHQEDKSIRRQSCVCFGAVGNCMNSAQINDLLKNLFLPQMRKNVFVFDTTGFQQNLFLTQGINLLTRSSCIKYDKNNIDNLLKIIFEQIEKRDAIDIDLSSQVAEVLELQLLTMDILYQQHSKYFTSYSQKIIDLSVELLKYDPMGTATYDQDQIEFDDDYYMDDVTDSTWRVRRSAAILLQTLLRLTSSQYANIAKACFYSKDNNSTVLDRLNEKNDEIRISILSFLRAFIQCSVLGSSYNSAQKGDEMESEDGPIVLMRRTSSNEIDIDGLLIKICLKVAEMFQNKDISQQVKSETIKLQNLISNNFTHALQSNANLFHVVLKIIKQILLGSKQFYNNEQRISAIKNLQMLFKVGEHYDHYTNEIKEILNLMIKFFNDDYIKVVAEALRTINTIINTLTSYFYQQLNNFDSELQQIKLFLLKNINQDNLDQEIKIEIIVSISKYLIKLPEKTTYDDLVIIMDTVKLRLKQDQLTLPIFRMLTNIKDHQNMLSGKVREQIVDIINNAAISIQKQDKQYRLLALTAINNLVKIIDQLPLSLTNDLLQKARQQILTGDQFLVDQVFILINQLLKTQSGNIQSQEIYVLCQDALTYASTLSMQIQPELAIFFKMAGHLKALQTDQVFKYFSPKQLKKEEIQVAGQVIANVFLGEYQQNLELKTKELLKALLQNTGDQQLQLSTLRFLTRLVEVSPDTFAYLQKQIDKKNEPELHALVLGSICSQNIEVNLPTLKSLIHEQKDSQYYYFMSLRELIDNIENPIKELIQNLTFYTLNEVKKKDKNIQRIISEILGKLCLIQFETVINHLSNGLEDEDDNVRVVCATASKHCFQKSPQYPLQTTQLFNRLITMIQKETQIDILIAVVKSITTALYYNLQKTRLDIQEFLNPFSSNCLRRFEIRELDFGNFKEKRDDAKDLRSLSFDLLEIGIEQQKIRGFDKMIPEILDEVIANFFEDKFDETRIPRLRILIKIANVYPQEIAAKADNLIKVFEPILKELSQIILKEKQQAEKDKVKAVVSTLDKDKEKLRLLMQSIHLFAKSCEGNEVVKSFYQLKVLSDKSFEDLIQKE